MHIHICGDSIIFALIVNVETKSIYWAAVPHWWDNGFGDGSVREAAGCVSGEGVRGRKLEWGQASRANTKESFWSARAECDPLVSVSKCRDERVDQNTERSVQYQQSGNVRF